MLALFLGWHAFLAWICNAAKLAVAGTSMNAGLPESCPRSAMDSLELDKNEEAHVMLHDVDCCLLQTLHQGPISQVAGPWQKHRPPRASTGSL